MAANKVRPKIKKPRQPFGGRGVVVVGSIARIQSSKSHNFLVAYGSDIPDVGHDTTLKKDVDRSIEYADLGI